MTQYERDLQQLVFSNDCEILYVLITEADKKGEAEYVCRKIAERGVAFRLLSFLYRVTDELLIPELNDGGEVTPDDVADWNLIAKTKREDCEIFSHLMSRVVRLGIERKTVNQILCGKSSVPLLCNYHGITRDNVTVDFVNEPFNCMYERLRD